MKTMLIAFGALAVFALHGCAMPFPAGPVLATEGGMLHDDSAFRAVEIEHRPEGQTLSLIAHDGVRISPATPEDEAFLIMPHDRRLHMIERLSDESVRRDRRVYHVW